MLTAAAADPLHLDNTSNGTTVKAEHGQIISVKLHDFTERGSTYTPGPITGEEGILEPLADSPGSFKVVGSNTEENAILRATFEKAFEAGSFYEVRLWRVTIKVAAKAAT